MRIHNIAAVLFALAVSTLLSTSALATNGYFSHGLGTKNKGQAGAGIASPQDAISTANNPADALVATARLDVGAALFSPRRSYTTSASLANGNGGAFTIGPNDIASERNYFVIPHLAYNFALSENSALGLAAYGRGGMNTRWQGGSASFDPDGPGPSPVVTSPGTYGAGTAGVDLSQLFIDIAYARQLNDRVRIGLSAVVAIQAFESVGTASFAGFTESFALSGGTQNPNSLSNNGHDWSHGVGLKAGINVAISPAVRIAGAYQSKIAMSEFDDYADLFAEAGDFDIPPNLKIGVSWQFSQSTQLNIDIEHTWFSQVASIGNTISNLFACPTAGAGGTDTSACLGGSNGAGFGWDDVTAIKLGVEHRVDENWTWRAGVSHAEQPISSSEAVFNILAPAVIENHLSAGFSRRNGNRSEISGAITHAFGNTVSGPNTFDPSQTIDLQMSQWELEISYSHKF